MVIKMRREFKPVERPEDEKPFSFKNRGDRLIVLTIALLVVIISIIVALIIVFGF